MVERPVRRGHFADMSGTSLYLCSMARDIDLEDYGRQIGKEVGLSPWRTVDQKLIDSFADVTDDRQFIHVDPAKAARTPFGTTIAHGMLVLSLIPTMASEALPTLRGTAMSINYGFDRVRFISPVPVGARLRGRFVLEELNRRGEDQVSMRYDVTVEREGADKPAASADWLVLNVLSAAR
jgi:acyl dehydratase